MRSAHEISYEEWVEDVFVHARSRGGSGEFGDYPADIVEGDAPTALRFFMRLMQESGALVGRFTSEQIGSGFWHLTFSACSEYGLVMTDTSLPLEQRITAIRSIADVYRDCFQRVCTPSLCHLERGAISKKRFLDANGACYMWWDVCPIWWRVSPGADTVDPDHPVVQACFRALESTLEIDHVACIEGALHGLGHAHGYCPEEAKRIVERFIARGQDLPAELIAYAEQARTGDIE